MTEELIKAGVAVKVRGTCQVRCGIRKGDPYYDGAHKSTMAELSQWVRDSDRMLTFWKLVMKTRESGVPDEERRASRSVGSWRVRSVVRTRSLSPSRWLSAARVRLWGWPRRAHRTRTAVLRSCSPSYLDEPVVERLLPEHDPEFQPTYGPWFTQAIGGDSRVWIVEGHRLREVSHRYGAMLRREMRIID